ncbi:MAG TPA: DUF6508 domain-containing protein [Chitinophagaceae bacterium]
MTTASLEYKAAGLQRILAYKTFFDPEVKRDSVGVNRFINLFCEYQLADNNYGDIHFEGNQNKDNPAWFATLSLDQVLQYITYIIWTDRFMAGYLESRILDRTMYHLLSRMEQLEPGTASSSTGGDTVS